jgi:hypothetical protein
MTRICPVFDAFSTLAGVLFRDVRSRLRSVNQGFKKILGAAAIALVAVSLGACACDDIGHLEDEGTDPDVALDERLIALHDALQCRQPGVAQDLTGRAEALLATTGRPEQVAKDRQCALDVLGALVRAPERSAAPLATRLADHESPLNGSRDALEVLARHPDPTVRGLAREQLARLRPPPK